MRVVSREQLALLRTVTALVGFGAFLYGIGFLALSAHYHGLGLWAGDIATQDISEEGGRFLYHLLFLIPGLLSPLGWGQALALFVIPLIAATIVGRTPPAVRRRLEAASRAARRIPRLVVLAAVLVASVALAETVWRVLDITELLYVRDGWLVPYRSSCERLLLYWQVIARIAVLTAAALALRRVWKRGASAVERTLVALQWAVALSAIVIWPIAYGKLVISDVRPTIQADPGSTPQLLIRSSGSRYFLWNRPLGRMEILEIGSGQKVDVGPRQHLLE